MRRLLPCFFMLVVTNAVLGQNAFRRNTLYGEFAGNGIFLSVNYERQLANKPGLGFRVGAGQASSDEVFRVVIPVGMNYLVNLRNNRSFIDLGLGATWSQAAIFKSYYSNRTDDNSRIVTFVPSIAYRFQAKWGLMGRIGFSPLINRHRFIPYPELSLGMSF